MAKKMVSPGVFTSETDQSFLQAGVAGIGAVVIGRTLKGPAFTPTVVSDYNEFKARFGGMDSQLSVPYAAKNYLKNATTLTVVRVLGTADGQDIGNGFARNVGAVVESGSKALAHIHYRTDAVMSVSGAAADFVLKFMSGATTLFASTASFNTSSVNYVGRVLNTDPTLVGTYGHYLYKLFPWNGSGSAPYTTASLSGASTGALDMDYTNAKTPWVYSQPFGGSQTFNLFRLHTNSSGEAANTDVKVTITNIRSSVNTTATEYGQFDVIVRAFGDTDNRPVVLETFLACNLDPDSINFVARRIGDSYETWNNVQRKFIPSGSYRSKSRYIRVEMATGVDAPEEALPWGFGGYPENVTSSGSSSLVDLPLASSNLDTAGNVEGTHVWGLDFDKEISDRLKVTADGATTFTGSGFSLSYVTASDLVGGVQSYEYDTGAATLLAPTTASINGFSMAFYGGFDGWDVTDSDPTDIQDDASATDIAVVSLKAGVDAVSNPDFFDMNLMAIPGCISNRVNDYAREICNERADCMFLMDITGSSVSDAINKLNDRGIDDNYTACFYPDMKIRDPENDRIVQVKPSTVVLAAYAFSDKIGQVFFAPAGLTRGGLNQFGVVDVADRLTFEDRNDLYENKINPIASFPNEGIVVFGQKTLQATASALDRINVRRLLIFAKKTVASAAKYLVFEPGNPNTWDRFVRSVNPILDEIRQNQGIERFKVVMDSTVNTPDIIDRNQMVGKIFLQPTRSAEFIDLGFVITASGVSFDQ